MYERERIKRGTPCYPRLTLWLCFVHPSSLLILSLDEAMPIGEKSCVDRAGDFAQVPHAVVCGGSRAKCTEPSVLTLQIFKLKSEIARPPQCLEGVLCRARQTRFALRARVRGAVG